MSDGLGVLLLFPFALNDHGMRLEGYGKGRSKDFYREGSRMGVKMHQKNILPAGHHRKE